MDFKRNYHSNIQPPTAIKGNHLVNPLINIAHASTPVRTRVIKPGSQMNSTPVSVNKIGKPIKSPALSNKENDEGNSKISKKHTVNEKNINLSPIMALNRKMSEGPQRSYTPTGFARQQSMVNIHENNDMNFKNEYAFNNQQLRDSKNSNSFKSMLESRSKTPTQLAFGSGAQHNLQGLRSSGSASSLLIGFNNTKLKESRSSKLSESRSFQHLLGLNTPLIKQNEILCSNSNEHQKKVRAKYKVVEDSDDDQLLVYCSKCAINLVKKGFKVEDLTAEDIYRMRNKESFHQDNANNQQYYDYADQTRRKLVIRQNELNSQRQKLFACHQKELENIDCYYNSIMSIIKEQRIKDRQNAIKLHENENNKADLLQRRILEAVSHLEHLLKAGNVDDDDLSKIQNFEALLTERGLRSDDEEYGTGKVQRYFNRFCELFQQQIQLRVEYSEDREYHKENIHSPRMNSNYNNNSYNNNNNNYNNNKDCPLRFSFQKTLKQANKNNYKGMMNPLEQATQQMEGEGEDSGEVVKDKKNPFRTLFPEEESADEPTRTGIHSPTFKQF